MGSYAGAARPPSGFTVPTRTIGGVAPGSDSEGEVASLMQRFPSASQGACPPGCDMWGDM
jgi:hypothetical protein